MPRYSILPPIKKPKGYEFKRGLRYSHEAVADFLVANPVATHKEIAEFFGYTPQFVSLLIHSNAFQAYYRKLAEERGVLAVHSIADKINELAALALDAASCHIVSGAASEDFVHDTAETMLRALGYIGGAPPPSQQQQNHLHVHVDANELVEARERAAQRFNSTPEPQTT